MRISCADLGIALDLAERAGQPAARNDGRLLIVAGITLAIVAHFV